MVSSSFIEIETDFDYVKNDVQEKAARFLMDFYHVDGELKNQLNHIAKALEETALQYLEIQGIPASSNLGRGIKAWVHGPSIELRSTAYRMPTKGQHRLGGKDMTASDRQRAVPEELRGSNRMHLYPRYGVARAANQMIVPQGAKFVGAAGGHWSLARNKIEAVDPVTGEVDIFYSSHGRRYGLNRGTGYNDTTHTNTSYSQKHPGTRNVQYYGAHVEFGHKTRDGGGIGFVQARPHLRPALRTVADASTGWLSQTMAGMLYGLGNTFETYRHQGQNIYGLKFGINEINQSEINKVISRGGSMQIAKRAMHLRRNFSIEKNTNRFHDKYLSRRIGFGKKIDYTRYGYNKETMELAYKAQITSKSAGGFRAPKNYVTAGQVRTKSHADGRYNYSRTRKSRTTSYRDRVHNRRKSNSWRTIRNSQKSMVKRRIASKKAVESASSNKKGQSSSNNNKDKNKNIGRGRRRTSPKDIDFSKMTPEEEKAYYESQIGRSGMGILSSMRRDDD